MLILAPGLPTLPRMGRIAESAAASTVSAPSLSCSCIWQQVLTPSQLMEPQRARCVTLILWTIPSFAQVITESHECTCRSSILATVLFGSHLWV